MSPPMPVDDGSVTFNAAATAWNGQLSSLRRVSDASKGTCRQLQRRPIQWKNERVAWQQWIGSMVPQHFLPPAESSVRQRRPKVGCRLLSHSCYGRHFSCWQTGGSSGSVWNRQPSSREALSRLRVVERSGLDDQTIQLWLCSRNAGN
jgi:hypothetical protein